MFSYNAEENEIKDVDAQSGVIMAKLHQQYSEILTWTTGERDMFFELAKTMRNSPPENDFE